MYPIISLVEPDFYMASVSTIFFKIKKTKQTSNAHRKNKSHGVPDIKEQHLVLNRLPRFSKNRG